MSGDHRNLLIGFCEMRFEDTLMKHKREEVLRSFGKDADGDLAPGMVSLHELGLSAERCSICCETSGEVELFLPDRLCQRRKCSGAFCLPCLKEFYSRVVEAARYAVPTIRCPTCRGFVRAASWTGCIDDDNTIENAEHLLTLRCISCDLLGSLFVCAEDEKFRSESLCQAFEGLSLDECHSLCEWWEKYSFGEAEAMDGLSLLSEMWPPEERVPDDVPPPLLQECVDHMLGLIEDDTRRVVFQLAFLRRWPKTFSLCCLTPHCFKCKVSTHHTGFSCEEVQRRQLQDNDIQCCPSCCVPTMKSEGCNGMMCVCGEYWVRDG